MSDNDALVNAVTELTRSTNQLREMLDNDYPKRVEIDRRFVTKFQQQKFVVRLLVLASIATLIIMIGTIGSYSVCLVGQTNPGICKAVPGYMERIERREELDKRDAILDREIARLLKKQGLRPIDKSSFTPTEEDE